MSLGNTIARSQARLRQRMGTPVHLYTPAGPVLKCETKAIPDGLAGLQFLGRQSLGHYGASADPRAFYFSPADFAPRTAVRRPVNGDRVYYGGLAYQSVDTATENDFGADLSLTMNCYRVLMSADPADKPLFDTELASWWRPGTLKGSTDPVSLNVKDVADAPRGNVDAFFVPLEMQEKMGLMGSLDVRVDTVYTNVFLRLGDVLYRTALGEAWVVIAPTEKQPGTGLLRSQAKHLQNLPPQIRAASLAL